VEKVRKTDAEWRAELSPEQYEVLRHGATEAPFTGEYDHVFADGVYRCAGCGAELFGLQPRAYLSGRGPEPQPPPRRDDGGMFMIRD